MAGTRSSTVRARRARVELEKVAREKRRTVLEPSPVLPVVRASRAVLEQAQTDTVTV